jgi:hypothetical protein
MVHCQRQLVIAGVLDQSAARSYQPQLHAGQRPLVDFPRGQAVKALPWVDFSQFVGYSPTARFLLLFLGRWIPPQKKSAGIDANPGAKEERLRTFLLARGL